MRPQRGRSYATFSSPCELTPYQLRSPTLPSSLACQQFVVERHRRPSLGSCRDRYRGLQKATIRSALRTHGQALVRQRDSDVALLSTHSSLEKRPVDHVALRFASTHLPKVEASRQQVFNCPSVRTMVEGAQSLNNGQTNIAIDRSQLSAISRGLAHRFEPA